MSVDSTRRPDPVAALRQQFDEAFAQVPAGEEQALESLLAVRCGGARYAVRVTEIAALIVDVRITPVATPLTELLGIAGIRGAIVPVYDLAAILGQAADVPPRWIALAGSGTLVALAFAGLERHLRVPADRIVVQGSAATAPQHSREVVTLPDGGRPIISIASVLEAIESRVRRCRDTRGQ